MKKRAAPAADSDFLDIIDDRAERGGAPDPGAPTWRLLIVDDEPEVHSATIRSKAAIWESKEVKPAISRSSPSPPSSSSLPVPPRVTPW